MRILLVDDHALFRIGLEGLLERREIEVVASVGDGREGIELARKLQPDVVLLDMRMPDVNGIQVLRQLRDEGLEIPIVMLTTSNEERDLIESFVTGHRAIYSRISTRTIWSMRSRISLTAKQ